MILRLTSLCLMLLAGTAMAQERVSNGTGVVLRALNKVSGRVLDVEIGAGQAVELERLTVALSECRFPEGNPSGDAYAYLVIVEEGKDAPVFQGWMVASSPALNALDHPRYDIWVLRCKTS